MLVSFQSSQDYFITTASGVDQLQRIPDFVIGRAGYDNWLVSRGLIEGWMVIDASQTVTARHQMSAESSSRGHAAHYIQAGKDGLVNYALAAKHFDYSLGLTDCARYETVATREAPVHNTKTKSAKPILSIVKTSGNTRQFSVNQRTVQSESIFRKIVSVFFDVESDKQSVANEAKLMIQRLQRLHYNEFTESSYDSELAVPSETLKEQSLQSKQSSKKRELVEIGGSIAAQGTIALRVKELSRYCKRAYFKNGLNPLIKPDLW